MNFSKSFLELSTDLLNRLDVKQIEAVVEVLSQMRDDGGRLFLVGSGGGAGHSSHAACDFRKLCAIEAYAPYDNVAELTARVNDEGWDTTLSSWLMVSKLSKRDCLFVFSVGGGSSQKNISTNIVKAVDLALEVGASITGVLGRDGGYTASRGGTCILIPAIQPDLVTPLTEGLQSVIWHLLISHPRLKTSQCKWESTDSSC